MDGLSVPSHGFKLICGTGNHRLSGEIAKSLDVEPAKLTVSRFADGEIFVRIDDQDDWSRLTRNHWRTTENQTGDIIVSDECQSEERCYGSHIDMPPIRAKGQTLDPFRAINGSVRPFVGHFRL